MISIFENILPLGVTYFSFMFAMGVSVGFVILGIFSVYFGIGKTKRIGSIVGLFGMVSLIVILSMINPPTNWIEIGILSTIGILTGITISSLLIFKILSRIKTGNKNGEIDKFEDVNLEDELKKLEREMKEDREDD